MSKKINITIPNKIKPNLVDLFHEYLSRKAKEPKASMGGREAYLFDDYEDMAAYWDKVFPGWDEDLDDDGDIVFPNNVIYISPKTRKRGKHKHNKKGKKAKIFNISVPYSGDETDLDEYDFDFATEDYDSQSKEIWFYPDYHCKDDKLEFNSLKEFSDYCESMGYWVDKDVTADISWRYESHCCLKPESEKVGLLEIMSEHTYGEMFYEACEESELGD